MLIFANNLRYFFILPFLGVLLPLQENLRKTGNKLLACSMGRLMGNSKGWSCLAPSLTYRRVSVSELFARSIGWLVCH